MSPIYNTDPKTIAPRWVLGGSVRLKTGGPVMTVLKMHPGNKATVAWFESGTMRRKIVVHNDVITVTR